MPKQLPPEKDLNTDQSVIQPVAGRNKFFRSKFFWPLLVAVVLVLIIFVVLLSLNNQLNVPQTNQPPVTYTSPSDAPARFYFVNSQSSTADQLYIKVNLDTLGSNIVVAQAVLEYDPDVLEFEKIDATGSVLNMKIIDDIKQGRINFVRSIPGDSNWQDADDGFTGNGEMATVIFKVLKKQTTHIDFDQSVSKIILDDGQATSARTTFEDILLEL